MVALDELMEKLEVSCRLLEQHAYKHLMCPHRCLVMLKLEKTMVSQSKFLDRGPISLGVC